MQISELQAMTVLQLRKLAKDSGVKLSAGIDKEGIVNRIAEKMNQSADASAREALSQQLVMDAVAPAQEAAAQEPDKPRAVRKGRKRAASEEGEAQPSQPCVDTETAAEVEPTELKASDLLAETATCETQPPMQDHLHKAPLTTDITSIQPGNNYHP